MRPLAHVLDQHDDEDRLKGSATIARMMAEDGKSMTARDPKGVGERRQASLRAGQRDADTGTAPEGAEPV